jgi:diguanylate cyclase (GGDEF)-like protein/PAS domain S-box-containing protein
VQFAAGGALAFAPEQLVGRALAEVMERDDQRDMVARAVRGDRVDEVIDWADRWWHIRYGPLVDDGVLRGCVGLFMDITERTLAQRALSASEAHLRGVLEAVREPLVVVDEESCITTSNRGFRSLFGPDAAPGHELAEAIGEQAAAAVSAQLARPPGADSHRPELRLSDQHGAPLWVLVSANPVRDEVGRDVGAVVVLTDITANKDVERRLTVAARTDPVTGAANRSTLVDRLDTALARRDGVTAALFCDVDGLKAVNDQHGHAAGDRMLRAVATRIRSALRPSDSLVRYGGDEFVVVCDALPNPGEAADLAERIRAAVSVPVSMPGDGEVVPTLSIGVATSPPRTGAAELLSAADAAAYRAKHGGRDTVRVDA